MNETMDENAQSGALPPPYVAPGAPPYEPRPPLRRSRDERMVGGVAGGLSRTFGVDPVVFRVVFAALTVVGGSGLVLYALLWLLVPEEGSDGSSIADRWVRSRSWSTATVVLLALAGAVAISLLVGLHPQALVLLAIIAVVALFLTRREQRAHAPTGPVAYGPSASPAPYVGQPYPTPVYVPVQPTEGAAGEATAAPDQPTQVFATQPAYATQPYPTQVYSGQPYAGYAAQPPLPPAAAQAAVAPPPPKPPKERSALGALTLGAAAVTAGVLVAVRLANDSSSPSVTTILAATTLMLGAGLLVGTFVGRARWLVVPGVLLLLATSASGAVDRFDGPRGDKTFVPKTAAAVPGTYEWGAGEIVVDLTQVQGDPDLTVAVNLGAGSLRVIVPEGAAVTWRATVGIGQIETPDGSEYDGFGNEADLADTPVDRGTPPSDQTIALDLEVGVGEVVVSHA